MNNRQAKEILMLYRPGSADGNDPDFAEAIELCGRDAELKQWFDEHCAAYTALRSKFKQIPIPPGLKEQIVSERKVHTEPFWKRPAVLAAAMAVVLIAGVLGVILFRNSTGPGGTQVAVAPPHPAKPKNFVTFREQVVHVSETVYAMDLLTNNLDVIRKFLADRKVAADFTVPAALQQNARTLGCGSVSWRGKSIPMLCFATGRPMAKPDQGDLWLFAVDSDQVPGAPAATAAEPQIDKVGKLQTASWSTGGKTYVLTVEGDPELLRKFL